MRGNATRREGRTQMRTHCFLSKMRPSIISPSFRTHNLSLLLNASRICGSVSVGLRVPPLLSEKVAILRREVSAEAMREDCKRVTSKEGDCVIGCPYVDLVSLSSGVLAIADIAVDSIGLFGAVAVVVSAGCEGSGGDGIVRDVHSVFDVG